MFARWHSPRPRRRSPAPASSAPPPVATVVSSEGACQGGAGADEPSLDASTLGAGSLRAAVESSRAVHSNALLASPARSLDLEHLVLSATPASDKTKPMHAEIPCQRTCGTRQFSGSKAQASRAIAVRESLCKPWRVWGDDAQQQRTAAASDLDVYEAISHPRGELRAHCW